MTERSDIHKYSIVKRQSSIPALPGWVSSSTGKKKGRKLQPPPVSCILKIEDLKSASLRAGSRRINFIKTN